MASTRFNILAIVTDPEVSALVEGTLSAEYAVTTAIEPPDGLRQFSSNPPDLIIQEIAGQALSEQIRQTELCRKTSAVGVPVLFLVENAEALETVLHASDGLRDLITKPLQSLELRIRTGNLIALRQKQQLRHMERHLQDLVAEGSSKLAGSENRFRLMVESIEDYAMFMVNPVGKITSWNRGAERLTGYSEEEALGQHFSILYPREELDEHHAMYELSTARKHGRYEEEGIRVRKDGSMYHAQIIVWRVDDDHGRTLGFAKVTRDITARKLGERALRESEAKFRTIANAMPQMVWSTRADGYHDYYNEQWYQFTGAPRNSTDGAGWNGMFHPEDQPRAWRAWQTSLATGKPYEIQYRLKHHSGEYRWTLGRALPVHDDAGNIVRWMGTCTDIHDQKRAEEALQEAARRKDEFLAMLAHELRNPLAPIYNSAQLIDRLLGGDPKLQHSLNVIERQVKHMSRLIDDLLDVARISRGKIAIRSENVELGETLRQTLDDYRDSFQAKDIRLDERLPPNPLWIKGDRTRIAQIIGNLLHNALKFTEPGGRVRARLYGQDPEHQSVDAAHNGTAHITIEDTGAGLDPALLEHLFDPFTQGTQSLARSQGGLGLGLALVKGFVELHGGSIHARSAGSGKGSAFTICFPLRAPPETVMPPIAQERRPTGRSLSFVLIDDNRDMVDTLEQLLLLQGHSVATAYDGDRGVEIAESGMPDVIICDIGLPGVMDGYAVARHLRANPKFSSCLLIALSGYGQAQDRKRTRESGFNVHMLKPLELDELDRVLASRW